MFRVTVEHCAWGTSPVERFDLPHRVKSCALSQRFYGAFVNLLEAGCLWKFVDEGMEILLQQPVCYNGYHDDAIVDELIFAGHCS